MPEISIEWVRPETLNDYWPEARALLQPAIDLCDYDITHEHLFSSIEERKSMLWLIYADQKLKAACVLYLSSERASIVVWFLGGSDSHEWLPTLVEKVKDYARFLGRDLVEVFVRPGLAKKLRRLSFKSLHEYMRLEV